MIAMRAFVRPRHHGRTLLMSAGFSVFAIPAWAQIRITDGNIPFLYESRADVRAPDHKLAAIVSTDYRNADDEFTRHDLFQQLKPVIENRLSQAEQDTQIFLLVGDNLGDYEFDRNAFPTGMSENTFIRFDHGYEVRFDNADQIAFIPLPPEEARSFASALRRSRAVTFRVEGKISRVAEDWSRKIVYVSVGKIVLSMKKGKRQIASYEIQPPSLDERSEARGVPTASTEPVVPVVERIAPIFDYTPEANGHPESANVTFAVTDSRPMTVWAVGAAGLSFFERFSSNMARDFVEILVARGYAIRGPFRSYNEMTFPDKEGSNLVLSATVGFTPDTSGLELVQLGVPNAVSVAFDLNQMLDGGVDSPYADARSHFKGTVRVQGRVTLIVSESLTNEKIWTKSIDIKPVIVGVDSTLPFLSTGLDLDLVFPHLIEHDNRFYTDLGSALEGSYVEIMERTYAYLAPGEMMLVDRQADGVRERKRY